ncbi:MAG TPA: hypothetical protein ENK02_08815 [Planctomycetes bacterium]|nr:hypothetical protein [Planctomycetota bacterium]
MKKNPLLLLLFLVFLLGGGLLLFWKGSAPETAKDPVALSKLSEEQGDPSGEAKELPGRAQGERSALPPKTETEVPTKSAAPEEGPSPDLLASPKVALRGIVLNPEGEPLPDAWIGFRYSIPRGKGVEYRALQLGSTELDGRFQVLVPESLLRRDPLRGDPLPQGPLPRGKLTVAHRSYLPKAQAPVFDGSGDPLPFRVQLEEGGAFSFQLLDAKGRPVPGLEIDGSEYRVNEPDAPSLGGIMLSSLGFGIQTFIGKSDASGRIQVPNWPADRLMVFGVFGMIGNLGIRKWTPHFSLLSQPKDLPDHVRLFLPKAGETYKITVIPNRDRVLRIQGRVLGFSAKERKDIFAWLDYQGSTVLVPLTWKNEEFKGSLNLFKPNKELSTFSLLFQIRDREGEGWKRLRSFGPFDLETTRSLPKLLVQKG